MPIYDILEHLDRNTEESRGSDQPLDKESRMKESLFSAIAVRVFFFMLLFVAFFWLLYQFLCFIPCVVCSLCSPWKRGIFRRMCGRRFLNIKRGAISLIAVLVALFSPALGIMVLCSYFLMYDREGMEAIVPGVLKSEFEELFAFAQGSFRGYS